MNSLLTKHVQLLVLILFTARFAIVPRSQAYVAKLQPIPIGITEYRVATHELVGDKYNTRRMLAPFQLCLACKCCVAAANPTTCVTMPCCFGINCQLPNKPFGVCAFVPNTCNCSSCAV